MGNNYWSGYIGAGFPNIGQCIDDPMGRQYNTLKNMSMADQYQNYNAFNNPGNAYRCDEPAEPQMKDVTPPKPDVLTIK